MYWLQQNSLFGFVCLNKLIHKTRCIYNTCWSCDIRTFLLNLLRLSNISANYLIFRYYKIFAKSLMFCLAHLFRVFLCCHIMCHCVLSPCCDVRYDFCIETMFGSSYPQMIVGGPVSCLRCFVFACVYWCSTHTVFCFLLCLSSSCVCILCLPVSLDCTFLIAPSVFSNVYFQQVFSLFDLLIYNIHISSNVLQ
jgi:hypothetical protein